jgi:hypothetical protein
MKFDNENFKTTDDVSVLLTENSSFRNVHDT